MQVAQSMANTVISLTHSGITAEQLMSCWLRRRCSNGDNDLTCIARYMGQCMVLDSK